jgi:hypothetical protein
MAGGGEVCSPSHEKQCWASNLAVIAAICSLNTG